MGDSQDCISLAPIQEHFWTAGEFGATDASWECVALRVYGGLDRARLTDAVRSLLARHEVLRSTVGDDGDGPVMRVGPSDAPTMPLTWIDLSSQPDADRDLAVHEAVTAFAETGVDLAEGPLLGLLAVRLGPAEHVLALAVHHLVADATAVRIIVSELNQDYLAALAGTPSPVPEPDLQYGDFAEWERTALLPAAEKADAPFWRDALQDAPAHLDLRVDRPRPPVKGSKGHRAEFRFTDATRTALLAFAESRRTTPYVASCAAFAALAARSAGVEEVVLGVLTANRTAPQVEQFVGQFANTLPLRIGVAGDPGFAELTDRCGRVVADAVDHGRLPWSRIVELAGRDGDASRTPVMQHLFLPKVDAIGDVAFGGHPTEHLEVRRERGRFDTIVEMDVSSSAASVWVEYDTALYTGHGIAELMNDFERVLAAWLAAPDTPVSALPLGPPPTGGGPAADLAAALGIGPSDAILVDGTVTAAAAIRAAAERAGATIVTAREKATVAVVPAAEFGEHVSGSPARLLVVDDTVARTDLELLRADPARRAVRLLGPFDGTLLAADISGLPGKWPVLLGGGPALTIGNGDGPALSPYSPGTLRVGSAPAPLTARWNPEGDIEIVDGVTFIAHGTGTASAETTDDPLLALMLELWGEALKHPEIGPDDDFFVVGGHSMVATRLLSDVQDSLGVTVRMRALFENPTPALFSAELRSRNPHLDELLTLVASADDSDLEADADTDSASGNGPAADTGVGDFPLLAAQRQLWLAEQANPGSLTHTIPLLLHVDGALDADALCGAVGDVVARQPGLRGTFVEEGGEPVQRIVPFAGFDVEVTDLSDLPPAEQDDRAQALKNETAYGGFDLTTGPLVRARLVRLSADRHVLHLLFHHLVTDEVSMTVFMREISEFYQARVEARSADLPALELGFADVVHDEQDMLAGPEGDRLRRFWTRELAGAPHLAVPTDHPRPATPAYQGEFLERRAPAVLADAIRECARTHRTTTYTVFCAAVVALLHRITGQDDVVIGAPSENRAKRGADRLIGCFLNVVPVRVGCEGDPAFAELLDRTGDALLRSYEHQGLPFVEIVDAVRPERIPGAHPVYQVTCELQLDGWMPIELPGCRARYELVSHGTARYDLSFHTLMRDDGMSLMLEIDTGLWDPATGLAHIDEVAALLERVTAEPGVRLSQFG